MITRMPTPAVEVVETSHGTVSYADYGSGRPCVAVHSLLTDRRSFDEVIPKLPGRIVTPDLPGFGETTMVSADIDAYADLIGALVTELGLEDPIIIGNGLGSFVSLGAVIRHPEMFARCVLVGAGAEFPEGAKGAFTKMTELANVDGMQAVVPIALQRIFTSGFLAQNPGMAEERARVLRETPVDAFVNACTALRVLDYGDASRSVHTPTMIVVGEDDEATPPSMAVDLQERIPNSRLVRLDSIAHAPQLQDPDGFVRAIKPFLEEE